ncbi:hypothetical protein IscW_ISCW012300 [Ixodes scapularis]|uniref:Uncharacterized protein n=1 Tax=Ixodes scapularis TaxID=6945 RepID=B7QG19_IXOSC|nr:hypothetical protein IscW_ISCW012300 [Ixodes scapularis]|eukprot:XP_002401101.1 hypothetical protein IscW_ISCW012300 [Ixodes scapularis]
MHEECLQIGSLLGLITYATVAVNYKKVLEVYDELPEMKSLLEFKLDPVIDSAVLLNLAT